MILGIDIGKNMGWFKGNITGPAEWGTAVLPTTKDDGLWLACADEHLRKMLRGATGVAIEQPYMGANAHTAQRLYGLLMHIKYFGHHIGLGESAYIRVPVSTGKLTLAGHGHATDEQMVKAAHDRGYMVDTDHEAHALACWWVWNFGAAEPIRKAKTRSSKPVVVKP